ncbi:MAG: ABC transporter permease [Weeksellaceae bacterium]|nr:ABC transporter permease [Weeksellaceae bacterium]
MSAEAPSLIQMIVSTVRRNPVALVALCIILLAAFVSVFSYFLAPDYTENAAQQQLVLKYKPMGYEQLILRVPSPEYKSGRSISDLFFGKTQDFEEIPVTEVRVTEQSVVYTPFVGEGQQADPQQISLERYSNLGYTAQAVEKEFVRKRQYLLGTDSFGRDFLSRMIIGTRISFFVGFIAVAISLVVGIFIGALGGYYRGKVDTAIMWLINVVWSVPTLLLVMAITLAIGKGFWQIFVAVGLTMWVEVARVVRGQFLSYRKLEFVEAARALGMSDYNIIFKQILPNILPPIIVISAANFAAAILIESGLSFLGIGAQPPTPSWGNIIKDHYAHIILGKQHLALLPGFAILMLVLAFNVLGNSLRDAIDVRS